MNNLMELVSLVRNFDYAGRSRAFVLLFSDVVAMESNVDGLPTWENSDIGPAEIMELFNKTHDIIFIPSTGIMRFHVKDVNKPTRDTLIKFLDMYYNLFESNIKYSDMTNERKRLMVLATCMEFSGVWKIYIWFQTLEKDDFEEIDMIRKYKEIDAWCSEHFGLSI